MRKKLIMACIGVCMSFTPISVVSASATLEVNEKTEHNTEVSDDVRERVYAEIRNGNISNDADVIKVALQQYEERLKESSQKALIENVKVDDSLYITQMVGYEFSDNGDVLENIDTTNLLVLDKNNNVVKASSFDTTGNAQLSEYSIYATMTVSVTRNTSDLTVRFNSFKTRLTYGTAITASSLTQASWYVPDLVNPTNDKTQTFAYPQANKDYVYTPNNKDMIHFGDGRGRACRSEVKAGTRSFIMSYSYLGVAPYPDGEWYTEYY